MTARIGSRLFQIASTTDPVSFEQSAMFSLKYLFLTSYRFFLLFSYIRHREKSFSIPPLS